jgi:MFS family permease
MTGTDDSRLARATLTRLERLPAVGARYSPTHFSGMPRLRLSWVCKAPRREALCGGLSPAVAALSWALTPHAPFGIAGWRWVVFFPALAAVVVWWIRREVPESPRWLVQQGRLSEADLVVSKMERAVEAESGRALPEADATAGDAFERSERHGDVRELLRPPIRTRVVGFVYSFSRLSTILTSLLIAYFSSRYGNPGVFAFIAASMVIAALAIGAGPPTRGLTLERISSDAA